MLINAESIKQIVKRIACRGDDGGERFTDTARVDAIAECLKNSQWQIFHDGELAKIYAHQKFDATRPVVVVSSHVDMVVEQCYAICDGEFWKGGSLRSEKKDQCESPRIQRNNKGACRKSVGFEPSCLMRQPRLGHGRRNQTLKKSCP